jgi:osmotically-inducible protein OsmY
VARDYSIGELGAARCIAIIPEGFMSDDRKLQEAVLAELGWEPSVVAAHIGVAANAGVVSLTGHVESFVQKHAAEAAARRVKGVVAVADDLDVRLPFENQRSDTDIAAAAVERLAWDTSVPRDAVQVLAVDGWITLTGKVGWHFQKDAAEQDVRPLLGVVGLSNQITIAPSVNAANISDDIMHALHRSWFFDPQTIQVSAHGGGIRLTGTVQSWRDRQVAAETAWAAPGATSVENDIIVI